MNSIKLYIDQNAFQKLRLWTQMAKGEISWLGSVQEILNERKCVIGFLIDEVHLLKQICSGTNTMLDDQSVAQFMTDQVKSGNDIGTIKAWLHSHGEFDVFWSATDEECIRNLANSSYVISLVTNKEGKMLARIDIFRPFHVTVRDVPVEIHYPEDLPLRNFCEHEFKSKVMEDFFFPDQQMNQQFTGMNDVDKIVNDLEEKVCQGRISLEEYEREMEMLEMTRYPEF